MAMRYFISILIASGVTFGLFWIMQALVASGNMQLDESDTGKILDMVRVDRNEEIIREDRRPERPPEIEETPPDLDMPDMNPNRPDRGGVSFARANVDSSANISGAGIGGAMDGEYLPIIKVQPVYPRRAQERGVSGFVLVEFTVTETGSVIDPVVIEADPPGYFERAALRAVVKFKYKPKVVNGEPVQVAGVRNIITFELEDE
jgi:periplasmic protein TonB